MPASLRYLFVGLFFGLNSVNTLANIFGEDTRVEKSYRDPVHRKIIYFNGCTGALVGCNLVLTAAHCLNGILERDQNGEWKVEPGHNVYAERSGRFYTASAGILDATFKSPDFGRSDQSTDWAILELDRNLGNEFGYFEVLQKLAFNAPENFDVWTAGFNGDRVAADGGPLLTGPRELGSIPYNTGRELYHYLDANRGASGAPLWKTINGVDTIVGLEVSARFQGPPTLYGHWVGPQQNWFDFANVAVNPGVFYNEVRSALRTISCAQVFGRLR